MKPWVSYSLLRLGLFVAVFVAVFAIGTGQGFDDFVAAMIAAVTAAIIGASVSYIFLARQREAVAKSLYAARHPRPDAPRDDEDAEDATPDAAPVVTDEASERNREG